jgi:hypothetical protein
MNKNLNFTTVSNSGRREKYSNACLWISILDYLNKCLNKNLTLSFLREKFDKNKAFKDNQEFNLNNTLQVQVINNLCNSYDLQANIYYRNKNKDNSYYLGNVAYSFGNNYNKHKVPIVAYGSHFELITSPSLLKDCNLCKEETKEETKENTYNKLCTYYVPKIYKNQNQEYVQINDLDEIDKNIATKIEQNDLKWQNLDEQLALSLSRSFNASLMYIKDKEEQEKLKQEKLKQENLKRKQDQEKKDHLFAIEISKKQEQQEQLKQDNLLAFALSKLKYGGSRSFYNKYQKYKCKYLELKKLKKLN